MSKSISIDDFFMKRLITSYQTKQSYKCYIKHFLKLVDSTPHDYFNPIKSNDEVEEDVQRFYQSLKGKAPQTIKSETNAVKLFLQTFHPPYKNLGVWEIIGLRLRDTSPVSDEKIPSQKEIETIFRHSDVRSKAFFLMQLTSGCRIGEIASLKTNDVYLEEKPVRLIIRHHSAKTKAKRNVFITDEAAEAYKAWLQERDKYIKRSAAKRKNLNLNTEYDTTRVFPFHVSNARLTWKIILKNAGFLGTIYYDPNSKDPEKRNSMGRDPETGKVLMHPHTLRKYFRSHLGNSDLAEALMGHKTLLNVYNKKDVSEWATDYLNCMNNLTIYEGTSNLQEINEQMKEKDQRIKELEEKQKVMMEMMKQLLIKDDKKKD